MTIWTKSDTSYFIIDLKFLLKKDHSKCHKFGGHTMMHQLIREWAAVLDNLKSGESLDVLSPPLKMRYQRTDASSIKLYCWNARQRFLSSIKTYFQKGKCISVGSPYFVWDLTHFSAGWAPTRCRAEPLRGVGLVTVGGTETRCWL